MHTKHALAVLLACVPTLLAGPIPTNSTETPPLVVQPDSPFIIHPDGDIPGRIRSSAAVQRRGDIPSRIKPSASAQRRRFGALAIDIAAAMGF